MKHFFFIAHEYSMERGYNRTIEVYGIKDNVPEFIGSEYRINTASYKGDRAEANKIISDTFGYKMSDGYKLDDKSINVYAL